MYALTIAGGKGERLRPLTDNLPKPLVDVGGKPLLHHQVNMLLNAGVTDIVFLCGYLGERIRDHFGDGAQHGFRAHYSFEEQPLGRGGALRQGFAQVPETEQLVYALNGDILTSQPLPELMERQRQTNATATVMLTPYPNTYGIVETDDADLVTRFAEKIPLPHWINAGIYLFKREIEPLLPKQGDHEDSTFPQLAREGKLAALKSKSPWRAVDSLKDRDEAERMVAAPSWPHRR